MEKSFLKACIYVIILASCDISCKKDETKVSACYLTQFDDGNGQTTYSLTYDDNNHTSTLTMGMGGSSATYNVVLNPAGNVTSIKVIGQPSPVLFTLIKQIFTYDQTDKLIQDKSYFTDSTTATNYYTYNSTNQLVQNETISIVGGTQNQDSTVYGYSLYEYPNTSTKNPSTITFYNGTQSGKSGDAVAIEALTYDTKKRIDGSLPGSPNSYNYSNEMPTSFATNNELTESYTFFNPSSTEVRTYTYVYNSSGYPISKSYTGNGGGSTYVDTFTYNCK